jgi:hypothetical protein
MKVQVTLVDKDGEPLTGKPQKADGEAQHWLNEFKLCELRPARANDEYPFFRYYGRKSAIEESSPELAEAMGNLDNWLNGDGA